MQQTLVPLLGAVLALAASLCSTQLPAQTPDHPVSTTRYDTDYPTLGYSDVALHNAFARLQSRLDRGEVKLAWHPQRGYLDALLQAMDIHPDSQVMVYSKTSLQIDLIEPSRPRAVYFNDEVYVGYVQGAPLIELAAHDDRKGLVFYALVNRQDKAPQFDREAGRCLTCHDTYSMMGGGVPQVVVLSAVVDGPGNPPGRETSEPTLDRTPLAERWGGWYVTGLTGRQTHLGNRSIDGDPTLAALDDALRSNLRSLEQVIDTRPYITPFSDVVALMVLEHQTQVHNLLTRAAYKSRALLHRLERQPAADSRPWTDLPPRTQALLKPMFEPVVRALLFAEAIEFSEPLSGTSGFQQRFAREGPLDPRGRSLRDLDLQSRLFRRPLSYMVQSAAYRQLPRYARDYIDARIENALAGQDPGLAGSRWSVAERREALEIWRATAAKGS
ncbi:MAG: hypothetical protein RL026_677 [Pseudomonadota bacterium]|jgi:hypothetical protein